MDEAVLVTRANYSFLQLTDGSVNALVDGHTLMMNIERLENGIEVAYYSGTFGYVEEYLPFFENPELTLLFDMKTGEWNYRELGIFFFGMEVLYAPDDKPAPAA